MIKVGGLKLHAIYNLIAHILLTPRDSYRTCALLSVGLINDITSNLVKRQKKLGVVIIKEMDNIFKIISSIIITYYFGLNRW